jgi:putative inorganic carbon (HCO3(-)) transporter
MPDDSVTSTPWSEPTRSERSRTLSVHVRPHEEEVYAPQAAPVAAPVRFARGAGKGSLPFWCFMATNALVFLRPSDLLPSLEKLPLYQGMMFLTILTWAPRMRITRAMRSPMTFSVLMLLPTVLFSHLAHMPPDLWDARYDTLDFAKKVIYYLMIVGLVTTPARLRILLQWITPCIIGLTALGLLQFHGYINFDALAAYQQNLLDQIDPVTGAVGTMPRLCSMGIFNDPNDLCMILCLGFMLCLYWMHDGQQSGPDGRRRPTVGMRSWHLRWVPVAIMFLWAVYCTHSRGGFLALLAGIATLIVARVGFKRSIPLIMVVLPVLLVAFAGRSTQIDTQETTAQDRIKLWSAGLEMFKSAPIFGIGMNQFVTQEKLVAHNSFVHCYSELGFVGGTLFMGGFIYAVYTLARLPKFEPAFTDVATARFQPYLIGAFASYIVGYLTLSRAYTEPTYLMWGMAAVYVSLASVYRPEAMPRLNWRMVSWAIFFGVCFVIVMYLFVRLFAHFG